MEEQKENPAILLRHIQDQMPALESLLSECNDRWCYEDGMYRFYHHSFKVYGLQERTVEVVRKLGGLLPGHPLDGLFLQIVAEGTGKRWKSEDNDRWPEATRPILEAFLHARYFLEMAVRYGRELESPPCRLPGGWAALLGLYGLR